MTNPFPGNPNWPANFDGCTITADYTDIFGDQLVGSVTFNPSPQALLDFAASKIIVPRARTIDLVAGILGPVVLPATDDPDVSPVFWTYRVMENFTGGRTYDIAAPLGQTVDLVNVAPLPAADGTPIVRGRDGTAVAAAAFVDGELILTLTDGSTVNVGPPDIDGGTPAGTRTGTLDGGTP